MNREIKFRAWNGEKMIYRGLHDRNWYSEDNGGKLVESAHPNDKRLLHIMEFTGLKDKNGVDIYEGDILQYGEGSIWSRFEVVWNKRYCQFELDWTRVSPNISHPSFDSLDSMFLIGNIHSNPELIK